MGISANNIDRLLPRHESDMKLDLTWNVRVSRPESKKSGWKKTGWKRAKKSEVSSAAVIRDISLEGALVEVADTHVHAVGEHVAVRFRDHDGDAVIRHCREGENDTLLYGVRFRPDPAFIDCLCGAVGELRGKTAELSRAWQRQN